MINNTTEEMKMTVRIEVYDEKGRIVVVSRQDVPEKLRGSVFDKVFVGESHPIKSEVWANLRLLYS